MSQDKEVEFRIQIARRKASGGRRVRVKRPQSFLDSLAPRRGGRSSSYRSRPSRKVQRHFHRRVIVQASIKRMVLVRGVRDDGKDLVIPREYISRGMRERAQEIASLELGPQSELEKRAKLTRTIDAQHKTDLDKMIERARDGETLDLRKPVEPRQLWRKQLIARRIKTLRQMGLAEYLEREVHRRLCCH